MKNHIVILKKSPVKGNKSSLYLTYLVRVHDNNKVEISQSNWLAANQIAALNKEYTPLNFEITSNKIEETRGNFDRFNKGANLIILRQINYPKKTTYLVLAITNNGLTSKEVEEQYLINYAKNRKPNPTVQNAIIRDKAIACFENAPFDEVSITEEKKEKVVDKVVKDENIKTKTPITSKDLKTLKAKDNTTVEIPQSIKESIFTSVPEANAALMESILELALRDKYSAGKIVNGKEKPFDAADPNANFLFEYILKQTTEYINRTGNEKKQKEQLEYARKWFGAIKIKDMKDKALRILVLK